MQHIFGIKLSAITMAVLLAGCSNMNANPENQANNPTNVETATKQQTTSSASLAPTSSTPPMPQTGFRFSDEENFDIANPNRLSHRIFYSKPSTGADAAWFDAVKRGDLPTVKYMVENGQDIEAKDTGSLNQTALGWAAFIGYEDMVDYLIAQGADLHATDRGDVYNVMKSAVLGKNTDIVKKVHQLLNAENPVDLNDQTVESDGETLIMVAASNNRLETVKYLLEQGADPNLVATTQNKNMGSYNQSAYSYACSRNLKQMQQLLAENGAINHRTGRASCE
ncbi:ankyrin repeat domain-containing protein [Psychrobacter sp. I-STPA10]|uniref:ankyrin repeat domain-containing protein n=1 Tax=Psychrobacter sp. I-STPA10 TaxID=2585769 RepID=UPI001E286B0B|nr:ankyrin repeat domain-containing protein [Psychrobacter sp. I-STPA10]